ncbi:MAG: NAD(P)/FAD-dependent oxidoreductase [Rickettsiales bacterium]|jgi:digeranylgeranylglycerophospholipid reductase|nr:NAD(P)/FAD-dependent oxidoreductase [Rickettsiales bacterium]
MNSYDVVIAGGGFGGLICAKTLAEHGIRTLLLERKKAPGVGMHTTGIIVGECAEEFALPDHLTRRITRVRLYAPNLKHTELATDSYFFLATDTPAVMRHLSDEAIRAGADILYDTPYEKGEANGDFLITNGQYRSRFLIGADGPRSKVADDFSLGQNTEFLLGAEAEYTGLPLTDDNAFYCFLDQQLARGYLGWVIPSVGVSQVGIAQRLPRKPDIDAFVMRMKNVFDFSKSEVVARRGGLIPVGGLVRPFAAHNVILLGDSAGIVSPLTAGGIHTAMHYGKQLGDYLADYMKNSCKGESPAEMLARHYPRFYFKQGLRKAYEHLAPDWLLNGIIGNPIFGAAANHIFFKRKTLR